MKATPLPGKGVADGGLVVPRIRFWRLHLGPDQYACVTQLEALSL